MRLNPYTVRRTGQDKNVLERCATVMDCKSLICHGMVSFRRRSKNEKQKLRNAILRVAPPIGSLGWL